MFKPAASNICIVICTLPNEAMANCLPKTSTLQILGCLLCVLVPNSLHYRDVQGAHQDVQQGFPLPPDSRRRDRGGQAPPPNTHPPHEDTAAHLDSKVRSALDHPAGEAGGGVGGHRLEKMLCNDVTE